MNDKKTFDIGLLAGMLLSVAAQSVNWLITPMSHPAAGSVRQGLVIAQALVCAGIALFLIRTRRPRSTAPAA